MPDTDPVEGALTREQVLKVQKMALSTLDRPESGRGK